MSGPRTLADEELRALRTAAQQLNRPRPQSVLELVQHLAGVQAQVLTGAGLALRARTEGLTAERVDRARLEDRSIVLTWAMRGTLHLIAAEDYGWLQPLVTRPRVANALRRLEQEGMPPDERARAIPLIERMLAGEGPLTRRQIAERLRSQRVQTEGQAIAHLLWLAAAEGVICHGPDRGRERCFVLVRDWIGEPRRADHDTALAALARRYLGAHGPATPRDLAFWSGVRVGDATHAWRLIQDQLVTLETARGTVWTLRSAAGPAPDGVVRLLPAFDEFLLGWQERDLTVAPAQRHQVNRGGGWLHPVVLFDGRVVATWSTTRSPGALRLVVKPFSQLPRVVHSGMVQDARDMAGFLGVTVSAEVA